jgi:EAL domain-containing protein (putative c-di-GMP-specific phosphodiesterase class I)
VRGRGDTGAPAGAPVMAGPPVEEVVANRLVTAHFQPIVHLDTRQVVAYEALARGPAGTAMENPAALFAAARTAGLEWELDTVAHAAAFKAALDANLHPSTSLFVNSNPASVGRQIPADLVPTMVMAFKKLRVFLEISEKAMSIDPDATLSGMEKARGSGWGVSLDNVGLTTDSLALMPFARPDVVKVDVSLVHERPSPLAPRVMGVVSAHVERTGAAILATCIESEAQARTARSLGATLGQGYFFGRPGPLPDNTQPPVRAIPLIGGLPPVDPADTPFGLATSVHPALSAATPVLESLASHMEQRAALDHDPPVVLACLPRARMMSGESLAFLQVMARAASHLAVLAGEPPRHEMPGVRIVPLADDDPLRAEWTMIIIGPHYSAMLTAREDAGDVFQYRLVYDRELVVRAARTLLHRVTRD